jgi:hypothetical protein
METGEARGEPRPPRRVVLLSESVGLAAVLKYLLGASGTLTRFATLREAGDRDGLEDADTVVLELPREGGDTTLAQVRHRYRGELIVLADRGQGHPPPGWWRTGSAWTVLERPFSAVDLGTALGLPGLAAATAPGPKADRYPPVEIRAARPIPAALGGPAEDKGPADIQAAVKRAPSFTPFTAAAGGARAGLVERASRVMVALTQGWQAKRRVRVAGFSAFALVAFTAAFALAAQSGRCGPGCDALGTVFSPQPTAAPSDTSAPSTTGPKRSTTTTAAKAQARTRSGTGAFRGISGGRLATTTTVRRATTTTRMPSLGAAPITRPPTTQPSTTPTTAPATTAAPTTTAVPTTITNP